jgi:2,3-bisphosphoglycerate-dependent phosphoglycerate mutase
MRLYLVRHGQTAWNAEERAQGHTDIPLDETGIAQAELLAEMLSEDPIQLVLTSDLQRSAKTAERIAERLSVPIEHTPILRERTFGEWEGLPYAEVGRRLGVEASEKGLAALYEACPPGGESMQMTWNRLRPMTDRLKQEEKNTLVVSHGGTASLLLSQLIRGDIDTARAFRFHNCAVTELLRRADGTFQMIRFNDASHLTTVEPLTNAAIR